MSDQEHSDEISEMLSGLRSLEPSLQSRLENRQVIAKELARLSEHSSRPRAWWNRSLSIPIPLAIAASLLLVYGATLLSDRTGGGQLTEAVEVENAPSIKIEPPRESEQYERSSFEVTETYLCGIGRLSTHSFHAIQEN